MIDILKWLKHAVKTGASDIFIGAGRYISFKIGGKIITQSEKVILPEESEKIVRDLYEMAHRSMKKFIETGDDDFPVSVSNLARFRISTYRQRGTAAAIIRVVLFSLPNYIDLHVPEEVMKIADEHHGLILVTGTAGSGKTTTLACIIDAINKRRNCHIITLEDPIEYLYKDDKSLISQREIAADTDSYLSALRSSLRQVPDVILLGEMRDYETVKAAMTASEMGHLVISTLHTVGAVNTIDRIIDVFPFEQQQQIRVQLSMLLKTVVSQQLLPANTGGLIPAFEIMHINNAIRNLIRESKTHQIDAIIQTSSQEGMISMDAFLLKLYQNGDITTNTALNYSINPNQIERRLKLT